MSEADLYITAKFKTGETFQAIGEVTFLDSYALVYDVDGASAYVFYSNLLYLLTETREPRPEAHVPPF